MTLGKWKTHKYKEIKETLLTNGSKKKSQAILEKYLETNKNKDTTDPNLYNTVKGVLKGNFIDINIDIKEKYYKLINLLYALKNLKN